MGIENKQSKKITLLFTNYLMMIAEKHISKIIISIKVLPDQVKPIIINL